jgi:predicted ATP-dependent serine protease
MTKQTDMIICDNCGEQTDIYLGNCIKCGKANKNLLYLYNLYHKKLKNDRRKGWEEKKENKLMRKKVREYYK